MLVMINTIKIHAQNVGIGIDTPSQKLEVNGGLRIGNTSTANPGAIRWNETKSDFEGYNGAAWVSLTGGKTRWGNQADYTTENFSSQFGLRHGDIPGTELGNAMAGINDWIVAGAYRDASPSIESNWHCGSIRLLKREGEIWKLKHNAYDPDNASSDFFGYSVGISLTHVISGASYANLPGSEDQGKAYIYTYDNNAMALQATLTASDGQALDFFGSSVAIDGDYAAVGAPGNDILGINSMGRVYIYNRSGSTWPQYQVLTPSDGAADDRYGTSISMWGEYLAISAPYKTYNGYFKSGKVYVYRKNANSWSLIQQINSPAPVNGEYFGIKVSIKDNVLLVGASFYSGGPSDSIGSVYIYNITNNTVTYEDVIQASDGAISDAFGASVAYLDGVIHVGAPYANVGAIGKQGKSYIFRKVSGSWIEETILTSSTGESSIFFGTSVVLVPDFGAASAPFADLNSRIDNGKLFFFKQY